MCLHATYAEAICLALWFADVACAAQVSYPCTDASVYIDFFVQDSYRCTFWILYSMQPCKLQSNTMHCGPMQTTICRHMRAVAMLCLCRLLPHADIICSFRPKNNAHNTANFGKHAILKFAALHGTVAHHSTICRICAKHMGSHMSLVPLSQSLLNGS
jgi:hypothetical protein